MNEDSSEDTSAPAIHIFEPKPLSAKKPKLSVKPESSEQIIHQPEEHDLNNELPVKENKENNKNLNLDSLAERVPNKVTNILIMEKDKSDYCKDSGISRKLRLSKNKFAMDDARLVSAMEQAVTEQGTQWGMDLDNCRQSLSSLLSNGSNKKQSVLTEFNTLLPAVNNGKY